ARVGDAAVGELDRELLARAIPELARDAPLAPQPLDAVDVEDDPRPAGPQQRHDGRARGVAEEDDVVPPPERAPGRRERVGRRLEVLAARAREDDDRGAAEAHAAARDVALAA